MAERQGRSPAKYRQIADHFRGEIRAGKLRPGDHLPSQADIERDFGAAMGTVVRALQDLRDAGLVETRHGVGTIVLEQKAKPDLAAEVADLRRRMDDVEALLMDTRAQNGLEQVSGREAEAR